MPIRANILSALGKLNPFQPKGASPPAPSLTPVSPSNPSGPLEADVTVMRNEIGTFTTLTPEQIQQRNYAVLASVAFDIPAHTRFLSWLKNVWRIVGPLTFVVFTAWEVFYFLRHFMREDDSWTSAVLLWGVTLLIEIPFMIATYDLATRKERKADAVENGRVYHASDTVGAIAAWCFLALVNIAGQVAFLALITNVGAAGNPLENGNALAMYFFIAVRVTGVIIGDAYTAFFLSPDETTIARSIRRQEAQSAGFARLSEASGNRKRIEAKANADLKAIDRSIRREDADAAFLEQINTINQHHLLGLQRQFQIGTGSGPEENQPGSGDL